MTALRATLSGNVGGLSLELELDCGDGPLVLVGPNGSGKTSVLLMLLGALPVSLCVRRAIARSDGRWR